MIQITKDTLRQLNAAVGKLDTDSGQVFAGFVGALNMSDKLYHGELRYEEPGDDSPTETVSLESIVATPAAAQSQRPKPKRSVTDGDTQPED